MAADPRGGGRGCGHYCGTKQVTCARVAWSLTSSWGFCCSDTKLQTWCMHHTASYNCLQRSGGGCSVLSSSQGFALSSAHAPWSAAALSCSMFRPAGLQTVQKLSIRPVRVLHGGHRSKVASNVLKTVTMAIYTTLRLSILPGKPLSSIPSPLLASCCNILVASGMIQHHQPHDALQLHCLPRLPCSWQGGPCPFSGA